MLSGCPEEFSPPFWGLDNLPGRCASASPSLPRVDIRVVRRGHRSPRGFPGGRGAGPQTLLPHGEPGVLRLPAPRPPAGFRPDRSTATRPSDAPVPHMCGGRPQRWHPWVLTIKGLVFECLKAGPGDWQSTPAPGETPPAPLLWCPRRVWLQTWPLRANFLCHAWPHRPQAWKEALPETSREGHCSASRKGRPLPSSPEPAPPEGALSAPSHKVDAEA